MSDFAPDTGKNHRVLFQFVASDEPSRKALISNLKNLLTVWPDIAIELVVHGSGTGLITRQQNPYAPVLQTLVENYTIRIVVCENSLRSQQLTIDDILPFVETVPVAIIELIRKQEEGWAYIKAGL